MPQLKPEGAPSPCPSPARGVRVLPNPAACALRGLAEMQLREHQLLLLPAVQPVTLV